ncbi:hypothetical protein KM800_13965 [Clostridium tyrobutyricum]|uniref:hypothetical protein n=1 Tax=Clostridium tyrobutyricum TaxID=1519 RepID=UPI001C392CF3|nr:hypothetical protein [Clostridium tyrobutyricum]MBV4420413.1 hypothetical protein [Clostridium tyrobutyricum]
MKCKDDKSKSGEENFYLVMEKNLKKIRLYQKRQKYLKNYEDEKRRLDKLEQDLRETKKLEQEEKRRAKLKLIDYEIIYELMKFEKKELFNRKSKLLKKFNIDNSSSVSLKKDGDEYFLEYQEEEKEPYAITKNFKTKNEALESLFKSSQYEIMRNRTIFTIGKDTCIYLKDNKDKIRLNSFDIGDLKLDTIPLNNARRKILLESLENNPTVRKNIIDKTLKKFNVETKGLDFKITDNINKAKERITNNLQNNEKINNIKTELKNDSHAFLEGFLSFYGIELNKKLDETKQPFEIINNRKGYSINKCTRKGELSKVSPYFRKDEAIRNLDELNNYLKLQKKRNINKNLSLNQEGKR